MGRRVEALLIFGVIYFFVVVAEVLALSSSLLTFPSPSLHRIYLLRGFGFQSLTRRDDIDDSMSCDYVSISAHVVGLSKKMAMAVVEEVGIITACSNCEFRDVAFQ